jgi:hypothetical protein
MKKEIKIAILQPISQIILFIILYSIIWELLKKFDYIKKHELWGLTILYLTGCFVVVSIVLMLLLFLKKRHNIIYLFILLLYMGLTFNNFLAIPKIVMIFWFISALSILIPYLYFKKRNN